MNTTSSLTITALESNLRRAEENAAQARTALVMLANTNNAQAAA